MQGRLTDPTLLRVEVWERGCPGLLKQSPVPCCLDSKLCYLASWLSDFMQMIEPLCVSASISKIKMPTAARALRCCEAQLREDCEE